MKVEHILEIYYDSIIKVALNYVKPPITMKKLKKYILYINTISNYFKFKS